MFLTDDEIRELTGRERRPAQIKQLQVLGVEFRQRADRSIVILRAHVEQLFGLEGTPRPKPEREPVIRP